MAVRENKNEEPEVEVEREPGFYVAGNGPYLTAEDAEAFNNGHLDGKGKVEEVKAND